MQVRWVTGALRRKRQGDYAGQRLQIGVIFILQKGWTLDTIRA
jgi:hypothetical protein